MRAPLLSRGAAPAALLALALGACGDAAGPDDGLRGPAMIEAVSGVNQSGTVAAVLGQDLVVRVADARDRPVGGQAVSFRVLSGGGALEIPTAVTTPNGVARTHWTLGIHTADTQRVEARVMNSFTGRSYAVEFTARPLSEAPVRMVQEGGCEGRVYSAARELVVSVRDRYANPVPGTTVHWSIEGDASITPTQTVTDEGGIARTYVSLGGRIFDYPVRAQLSSGESFALRCDGLLPDTIVLRRGAGDGQMVAVGEAFAPVAMYARTTDGRPLIGVMFQWVATFSWVPPGRGYVEHEEVGTGGSVTGDDGLATWQPPRPIRAGDYDIGVFTHYTVTFTGEAGFYLRAQ